MKIYKITEADGKEMKESYALQPLPSNKEGDW